MPRRSAALLALALLAAASVTGCTRLRQAREWWQRPPSRSAAPASPAPARERPYLASLIALGSLSQGNVVAIAAVNLSTLVANQPAEFVVVNKWGMIQPGKHKDSIHILDPDKRERIASAEAEFLVEDYYRNTLVIQEFRHRFTRVGNYWVQVYLDGELITEYAFRVRPSEP